MEMNETRQVKITSAIMMALAGLCLLGNMLGWFIYLTDALMSAASPLVCPAHSRLITRTKDIEREENGITKTHTTFDFDCIDSHGAHVQNNASMIFGAVCVLPFVLLMAWGFVSTYLRNKKNHGLSPRTGVGKRK